MNNLFKCPSCGCTDDDTNFKVVGTAVFEMSSNGTEDFFDVEYDDSSTIWCDECKHIGTVGEFAPVESPDLDAPHLLPEDFAV